MSTFYSMQQLDINWAHDFSFPFENRLNKPAHSLRFVSLGEVAKCSAAIDIIPPTSPNITKFHVVYPEIPS